MQSVQTYVGYVVEVFATPIGAQVVGTPSGNGSERREHIRGKLPMEQRRRTRGLRDGGGEGGARGALDPAGGRGLARKHSP